jgi:membrane associated rhomboid family serine protease
MLPLRDSLPSARLPVINVALVMACAAVFVWQLSLGPLLEAAIWHFGLVPLRYTDPAAAAELPPGGYLLPWIAHQFLHGGWLHLIGNLWMLWIFGDNVEDRFGHGGYLLLYLGGGLAAGLLHVLIHPDSAVPTIGASGAIAAVMGAYVVLYPRSRLIVVVPPFVFGPFFLVPAVLFMLLWLALQFFSGWLSLLVTDAQAGGVAWWAHIGGFVAGAFVALLAGPSPARVRRRRPTGR